MTSATQNVSGWSLVASAGNNAGWTGSAAIRSSRSRSQLVPSTAEIGTSAWKSWAARQRSSSGRRAALGATTSVLFSTHTAGPPYARSGSSTRSSGPVALGGVHHQADHVDVFHRPPGRLLHEFPELAAAHVQSRRVHEDRLSIRPREDAGDPVARGLRPRRHDRELLAHQPIQQRRLAGVRPPDQRHESGTMLDDLARARRAGPLAHRWSSPVHRRAGAPVRMSRSRRCMRSASSGSRSS